MVSVSAKLSGDAFLRQHGGNGIGGFPLKELAVDTFDDLRFLRDDLRQSVGTFAVAQELAVRSLRTKRKRKQQKLIALLLDRKCASEI